ncbi:MAG: hypothetical protein JWL85_695 [Candidatus Saccharibacteria bacterium]|nr:hypothetical protein [Candidatus Saccharibacteria bacterium]
MINRSIAIALAAGFLLGAIWLVALRYVTYKNDAVHYHANFALYINGQREEFKSFTYYEEVAACTSDAVDNPKVRVHMHDQNNHLIHVHASGVTWGHFFANLGFTLGDTVLKTDNGIFADGTDGNKLEFLLNGQKVNGIANKIITSEDTLLINYGKDSEDTLKQRYDGIPHDAGVANTKQDPSTCSGSEDPTSLERLKKSIGLGH